MPDRRDGALPVRVGRALGAGPWAGSRPIFACEEKFVKRKMLLLARAAVYLLAFVVPPVLISVTGVNAALSNRYEAPSAAPAGVQAGFSFDATLRDLAEHENAPVASFLDRLLEYPTDHLGLAGDGWPFARLLRPLAVGLLGVLVVAALDRLVHTPATKRLRRPPKGPSA
jgi:hypothetical protein